MGLLDKLFMRNKSKKAAEKAVNNLISGLPPLTPEQERELDEKIEREKNAPPTEIISENLEKETDIVVAEVPTEYTITPSYRSDTSIQMSEQAFDVQIERAKNYKCDLIEVTTSNRICGECAKYQGRIYSLSGKDKRYPKFPEYLLKTKCAHCGLCIYLYTEGISIARYVEGDTIKESNRPFVDNRTQEQIEMYNNWVKEEQRKIQNKKEFDEITRLLPDIAPKYLNNYSKMKNAKSARFIELVEKAKSVGIEIIE